MPSEILYIYLKCTYFLSLSPMKVVKLSNGIFHVHIPTSRKIISAVFMFLALLTYFTRLRQVYEETDWNNPTFFFKLIENLCSFIYRISFFKCLWCKKEIFEKLLNSFSTDQHLQALQSHCKVPHLNYLWGISGILIILSFVRLATPTIGGVSTSPIQCSPWTSPNPWARRILSNGRNIFLFETHDETVDYDFDNFFDWIIFCLTIISLLVKFITAFYSDMFIIVHVAILWISVRAYIKYLDHFMKMQNQPALKKSTSLAIVEKELNNELGHHQREMIADQYNSLKCLAFLVNSSLGGCVLPYLGEALFSTAMYLNIGFRMSKPILKLIALIFYFSNIAIWVMCGEICRKINVLRDWLQENQKTLKLPCDQLLLFLDSLSNYGVSITASGIFPLNYSVAAGTISAFMAYYVIQVQTNYTTN